MDRRNPSYAKAVRRNIAVRREKVNQHYNIGRQNEMRTGQMMIEDWSKTLVCTRENLRHECFTIERWQTRKSWQAHKIRKGDKPTITVEEDNVTKKETKDEDTKIEVNEDEDISKGEMIKDKYSYDEGEIIGRARVGNNGVV
ncbi:hypothetical protein LguiB_020805 [Lonicera macranthoides]